MTTARAPAKLNLALVVGGARPDGKHELVTVYQRLELADELELEPSGALCVDGFAGDTLVRGALEALAAAAGRPAHWRVRLDKRIPVAAGLGGGSSDAAAVLRLANATLPRPLPGARLHEIAAGLGADVPFFLADGPQLGSGDGTELAPLQLPQDYAVLLFLPAGAVKASTRAVYEAFDARDGATGFAGRRDRLLEALGAIRSLPDLAGLPPNDLVRSEHASVLERLGALRADVSGAGPTVYGIFAGEAEAAAAAAALAPEGRTIVTRPCW